MVRHHKNGGFRVFGVLARYSRIYDNGSTRRCGRNSIHDNVFHRELRLPLSMRFFFPQFPAEFKIPDDWWTDAGMAGFMPSAPTYLAEDAASCAISLRDIAPPFRNATTPKDFRGFDRVRMVSVLTAISNGTSLPPVSLIAIPKFDALYRPYSFGLLDGMHRFFGSIAAGFDAIPSTVREPFQ